MSPSPRTATPAIALCGEPAHQRDDGHFQLGLHDDAGQSVASLTPWHTRGPPDPEKRSPSEIKHSHTLASPGKKDLVMKKKENCGRRVVIAKGLACPNPDCRRPIQPYDVEWISEFAIEINCQCCHRTAIRLEG